MSQVELFNDTPNDVPDYEDGLCDCPGGPDARLDIDCGDISLTCAVCGKSLLTYDDTGLVFMDSTPVDATCIQEHDHHWDTIGCDCDYYWELKTRTSET